VPLRFSERMTPHPAARRAASCIDRSWSVVLTLAYPMTVMSHPCLRADAREVTASLAPVQAPTDRQKAALENGKAAVLSAAAIAALLVQESRQSYYASGHPCARPEDVNKSGRSCGRTSGYSRPGGAAPLCYVSDVSAEMIARYRANAAPTAHAQ
jgi:hypothetical protein